MIPTPVIQDLLSKAEAAKERFLSLANIPVGEPFLVCDGCGKCWPDDSAANDESCDQPCGRFKQRMEWGGLQDVAKDAANEVSVVPALCREVLALRKIADVLKARLEESRKYDEPDIMISVAEARELLESMDEKS